MHKQKTRKETNKWRTKHLPVSKLLALLPLVGLGVLGSHIVAHADISGGYPDFDTSYTTNEQYDFTVPMTNFVPDTFPTAGPIGVWEDNRYGVKGSTNSTYYPVILMGSIPNDYYVTDTFNSAYWNSFPGNALPDINLDRFYTASEGYTYQATNCTQTPYFSLAYGDVPSVSGQGTTTAPTNIELYDIYDPNGTLYPEQGEVWSMELQYGYDPYNSGSCKIYQANNSSSHPYYQNNGLNVLFPQTENGNNTLTDWATALNGNLAFIELASTEASFNTVGAPTATQTGLYDFAQIYALAGASTKSTTSKNIYTTYNPEAGLTLPNGNTVQQGGTLYFNDIAGISSYDDSSYMNYHYEFVSITPVSGGALNSNNSATIDTNLNGLSDACSGVYFAYFPNSDINAPGCSVTSSPRMPQPYEFGADGSQLMEVVQGGGLTPLQAQPAARYAYYLDGQPMNSLAAGGNVIPPLSAGTLYTSANSTSGVLSNHFQIPSTFTPGTYTMTLYVRDAQERENAPGNAFTVNGTPVTDSVTFTVTPGNSFTITCPSSFSTYSGNAIIKDTVPPPNNTQVLFSYGWANATGSIQQKTVTLTGQSTSVPISLSAPAGTTSLELKVASTLAGGVEDSQSCAMPAAPQNASIQLVNPQDSYPPDAPLNIVASVTNGMNETITPTSPANATYPNGPSGTSTPSIPASTTPTGCPQAASDYTEEGSTNFPVLHGLLVCFYNQSNQLVTVNGQQTGLSIDFSVAADNQGEYDIDASLPAGTYKMFAQIPDYSDETTYGDNVVSKIFTVEPTPPPNFTCDNGLTLTRQNGFFVPPRVCSGYYPNYPSTAAEGGAGSYFFVEYNFFPEPMPDYTAIPSPDGNPALTEYQPANVKISNGIAGDTSTYLFYPTSATPAPSTTSVPQLPPPYEAGPNSFYHYLYRGRMFAQKVLFSFELLDPMNQKVPNAYGSVTYVVPNYCITSNYLDYRDSFNGDPCRNLFFYAPSGNTTVTGGNAFATPPDNSQKIIYDNPGYYTFHFSAVEYQHYYYQHDNGYQVEGLSAGAPVMNASATSPTGYVATKLPNTIYQGPQNFPTLADSAGNWIDFSTFMNHCYNEADNYSNSAFINNSTYSSSPGGEVGSYNGSTYYCYHDNSANYDYWHYDWGTVTSYPTPGN